MKLGGREGNSRRDPEPNCCSQTPPKKRIIAACGPVSDPHSRWARWESTCINRPDKDMACRPITTPYQPSCGDNCLYQCLGLFFQIDWPTSGAAT